MRPKNTRLAVRFAVTDWAAATPDFDIRAEWAAWSRTGAPLPRSDAAVPASTVPASLRRRLDRLGRLAMQALLAVGTGPDDKLVFASRFGEMAKSFELLRQIQRGELPSPTAFALSVHNALAGQAAIAIGNRMAHSAVAAGRDTLAAGLIEAVGLAGRRAGGEAVLIHYDAPPPDDIGTAADEDALFALALRVTGAPAEGEAITLDADDDGGEIGPATVPAAAMLRFLADPALMRATWRGQRSDWSLRRAA